MTRQNWPTTATPFYGHECHPAATTVERCEPCFLLRLANAMEVKCNDQTPWWCDYLQEHSHWYLLVRWYLISTHKMVSSRMKIPLLLDSCCLHTSGSSFFAPFHTSSCGHHFSIATTHLPIAPSCVNEITSKQSHSLLSASSDDNADQESIDPTRFFLVSEVNFGSDGDFSNKKMI